MKIGVPCFALTLLAGAAHGQVFGQHCSNEDFAGTYGLAASGMVTAPAIAWTGSPYGDLSGPFARSGQFTPDGRGNSSATTFASYDGTMFSETITGTYSVSPNCSIVFNVQPFPPIDQPAVFTGLLSDDKTQVTFLISSPLYQTIHAVLTKQDTDDFLGFQVGCSNRDFSGPYALLMQGSIITPNAAQPASGDFVRVGSFTPDGRGNFAAQTTANYNGYVIQAENFTGTYTVAANCALTVQYTGPNSVAYTWHGSLINNSQGADLIVFNPSGSAIWGTLTQQ